MSWFSQLFQDHSSAVYVILIYAIVIAAGVALGKLSYKGVSFGIAFVLFTGIVMSYLGFTIDEKILEYIKDFGLILFVYTMGLQVGPGFFASLRNGGLLFNMLALLSIFICVIIVIIIFYATGIPMPSLVGLMSGAVTNTPGLGAAQQTVKDLSAVHTQLYNLPSLGSYYAIAYPGGVVGIILVMILLKWMLKIDLKKEQEAYLEKNKSSRPKPATITLNVENPLLIGKPLQTIFDTLKSKFVVSRIMHNNEIKSANKDMVLHKNDVVLIVANPADFERFQTLIGSLSELNLLQQSGKLITQKIKITRREVCSHPLAELDVIHKYGATITRVLRSGIEFIPTGHTRLQFGDIATVIGNEDNVNNLAAEFGNSEKELKEPNIAGLFLGIAIGVIFGSIPIALPGIPVPVKLGLAGGPLIVAIFISRYGSVIPVISYVTQSANYMVREIGIVLFLSSVGLGAGSAFLSTVLSAQGLELLMLAAVITVVPLLLTSLIARFVYKLNFLEIFGLLSGASTDPPALSFAIKMVGSDSPAIVYAGVYPLTMFLRILVAQLLILLFV